MKVYAQYRLEWLGYAVYFYEEQPDGSTKYRLSDGSYRVVPRGERVDRIEPTLIVDHGEEAQNLIEALQRSGVQPKQLTLIEGQHQAQSAHLADLQKILRKQGVME